MHMRIVLTISFFVLTLVPKAQTNVYLSDLAALRSILQKTPSYKAQIRGVRKAHYDSLFSRLAADSAIGPEDYRYFYNLSQLLFPLRDNHLGFYQLPDYNHFRNKESIDRYITSKAFTEFPEYKGNVDSLKSALLTRPADSVEGIYHYDRFYTVGVFKTAEIEYMGVVLDSEVNLWRKGQVAFRLYEYGPGSYKAIYAHPASKNYFYQGNEKYVNQSLVNSHFYASYSEKVYSKQPGATDHVNLQAGSLFEMGNPEEDVQYVLVRSFQNNNFVRPRSNRFYDSIKNILTAPYLILDLRNNQGGSKREAKKYFKLVKQYSRKGEVYVLLNNGTISQAERLAIRLRKLRHVTTVGQTTSGMLAYGSNYGRRVRLPSGQFEIYVTDLKGPSSLLRFENAGVQPDIYLNNSGDWIVKLLNIIGRSRRIIKN
jgi:hypothetical protein